jgi:microcin C transport system substrate-binding protein
MRFIISLLAASAMIGAAQADQTVTTKAAETKPASEAAKPAVEMIEATTIALRGQPFYKPDFTQFNYVKADAPLGGLIKDWAMGTFDNFNAYSRRGDPATGSSSLNADLMASSDDDLNALYPLVAEKIVYASDYSQITFHIDKRAVFHDGVKIKPSDIKFSYEKFTSGEALPGLKEYYSFVDKI